MEETAAPDRPRGRWGRPAGLVAAGLIAGGIIAGTLSASAQSSSPTASNSADSSSSSSTTTDRREGCDETPLTGATAQKVRAAALAAVPGGTVLRVETDSEGSPYEAHVRKADGTEVVVKVDEAFKVTSIETREGSTAESTSSA